MRACLRDLQLLDYKACWDLQQELFDALVAQKTQGREPLFDNDLAGTILLVEHPPVYTLGKSGHAENLLIARQTLETLGAEFFHIDRGGDITFHGPGQLVVYPILDLERIGIGLREYIDSLEQAVIRTAAHYGICAGRIAGASGVWITGPNGGTTDENGADGGTTAGNRTNSSPTAGNWSDGSATDEKNRAAGYTSATPRKLCAIGVRASRYVTMHGLALNVSTDLGWFAHMNPCGFTDRGVTSLERETAREVAMQDVKSLLVKFLEEELNVKIYK